MVNKMVVISRRFTMQILISLFLGVVIGLCFKYFSVLSIIKPYFIDQACDIMGKLFVNMLKMLVLPIVIVSLVSGVAELKTVRAFGRVGGMTMTVYLFTTSLAVALALYIAAWLGIGLGASPQSSSFTVSASPSVKAVLVALFPSNIFEALAHGDLLPVIVFSILLGLAINSSGEAGVKVAKAFSILNTVVIRLVIMVIKFSPVGVFCLLAKQFSSLGWTGVSTVSSYFFTVVIVLLLQFFIVYFSLIKFVVKASPWHFLKKMYPNFLFAFSVSSSSATLPVTLNAVRNKLGVNNTVASFVVPLGATVNMDGTAIMQAVATVFVAHLYNITLGVGGYLTIMVMTVLASIGTAGVPGVGLITLSMVLTQLGLPVSAIGMIIGVDRLLDMMRTAVNVAGDCVIALVVAKFQNAFDEDVYYEPAE